MAKPSCILLYLNQFIFSESRFISFSCRGGLYPRFKVRRRTSSCEDTCHRYREHGMRDFFLFFLIDLVLCLAHVTSCRLIWNIQQPDLWRRLNYELYTNRCFSPSRKLGKKMKLTKIETYSQKYFRLSNNYWVRV